MPHSVVPMTSSQLGMYFDAQLRDASDYHVTTHLRIEPVDTARLERAVNEVMAAQPALRSAVRNEREGVSYVVARIDAVDVPVTSHDLRGADDARNTFARIVSDASRTPFDLAAAPLFRIVHGRFDDEDQAAFVCHHLIADGQSVGHLIEQVLELALGHDEVPEAQDDSSGVTGRAGVSTDEDQGLAVYHERQAAGPGEGVADRNREFWERNLARQTAPDLSHWMGSASTGTTGRELRIPLDSQLTDSLRTAARAAEVSEYTVYLGMFGVLLARYAHAEDLAVAVPLTDRPAWEMERSIGCFIRTLPVHIDVTTAPTVRELLTRLRGEVLDTWKHIDHPVTALLGDHPALARVFDVTFIHDSLAFPAGVRGPAHAAEATADGRSPTTEAHFPGSFTVIVEQLDGATELVFQFKEPNLTERRVRTFAERYVHLLAQLPAALDEPTSSVRTAGPDEDAALLADLSDTHLYDWTPTHLGDLFLARTTTAPARVAWTDAHRTYTNAWAHDAAVLVQRRLLEETGGEPQRVGVLLPRGAELLSAVFGTALAGCAYVPLSEGMSNERLAQIFADADITVVLTTSGADRKFPAGVTRVDLDTWDDFAALADDVRTATCERAADTTTSPDDVLYVEYTSGSTGVPKGVAVTHANVQNTALDLERRFPLAEDDVYLLKTTFTFDIFGTEVYGWLAGAGRLAILPPGQEGDVLALIDAIRAAGVTHVNFTPTALRIVLDAAGSAGHAARLDSLRYVFSGGEALTPDIVERFAALPLTCSLENVYGPTEATMWATHTTIVPAKADTPPTDDAEIVVDGTRPDTDDAGTSRFVPVGTPLNDYRVYVLDGSDAPCGVDIPGELCIAGAGVAAGYLNRDELNARQFVANPFFAPATDPEHMRRMYRTGDLGYLRSDGRFAFLRRMDRQVKVGGVRMELGEIEQALLRTGGVVEAAAVIDDDVVPPRLVGFYTTRDSLTTAEVRTSLAQALEPQMVPSLLIELETLPTSTAGKLDRRALKELLAHRRIENTRDVAPAATAANPRPSAAPSSNSTRTDRPSVTDRITARWRTVLETTEVDPHTSFFDQGGNSLTLMRLQLELHKEFDHEAPITHLLKHTTVTAQAELFDDGGRLLDGVAVEPILPEVEGPPGPVNGFDRDTIEQPAAVVEPPHCHPGTAPDIAIIGIGIQTPGAQDVHEFWKNLRDGDEGITFYDDDELRALGVSESDIADPLYVKANGRLDGIGSFDDALFGIPPAETDATSPQLRVLYETFWQACEDAGYDPRALPGRVGVFAGGNDDFLWYQDKIADGGAFGDVYQNFTLATNHFLGTRLSYLFDLTGPSMSALTGCSTSLMTVHLAVQSLRLGECDLAVAGGVTVELPNDGGYRYSDGMMFSPDGHCRPFDADAAGTMFSNGAALLMLKPVEAAVADGDQIYGVIKGSSVGNDGRRKLSYTAPSEDGQFETIRAAYDTAGIDPASVSYVEAHGTGTLLGDPIEVASLTRVFEGAPTGATLLGSVKGNVGHTDSAAGSVGLSKVALSLKHRYLPGTRNFSRSNPNIDFPATPFRVTNDGQPWRADGPLRAGINSFGVGGTNVHMIVEEGPDTGSTRDNPFEVLQFSAASPEALDRTADAVVRHVAGRDDVSLSDTARTLRGRAELSYRKSMVVSAAEPRDADLWAERIASMPPTTAGVDGGRTALLFSGQGNQYRAMGRDLYGSDSPSGHVFRTWIDGIIGHLPEADAAEFRDVLYGDDGDDARIHRTEWSQLALFASQFAMAKVVEAFGVVPGVMVGHSIGELTAAALAGVWDLPDAVRLVRARGSLMQAAEPGVMVAVLAPAAEVRELVDGMDGVWLSLDNSARRCVLGMRSELFDDVTARLDDAGLSGIPLQTSHAFHTPMMNDAAKAFEKAVAEVETRDPGTAIISNRTGRIVRPGEMTDPAYWGDHIIGEVRFTDGLVTLLGDGPLFGIELGPGASLTSFASHDPAKRPDQVFVNLLQHAAGTDRDEAWLMSALGTLWSAGLSVDWSHHTTGRRVSLPGYSFDRTPHPVPFSGAPGPTAGTGEERTGRPAPQRDRPGSARAAAPVPVAHQPIDGESDLMAAVQAVFVAVLGYTEVASDADFFALGGDSLKATGLAAQLTSRLGVTVTVADVFAATTPAALAERFDAAVRAGTASSDSHGVRPAPEQDDYPISPAQARMYVAAQLDPGTLVYNMASATWLDGMLDPDRLRTAMERLVARHEPLRTTFALRDGEIRQRAAPTDVGVPGPLPLEFSRAPYVGQDVVDGLMARFVRPFDLRTGPLFRMEVVDGGTSGSLLLFDIHHVVGDAVSAEIIARDLGDLYAGDLPPLALHHKDVVMYDDDTRAGALADAEAHLLETLRDAPSAQLLSTDRPRSSSQDPSAGRVKLRLDPARMRSVRTLAGTHDATPFMVLLSAWGATLARGAGRDDLVIGAPVTGRTLAETQEMVGMFVNMMPLRLRPVADLSFGDYLAASRTAVLDALKHQDVPFDRLVDGLGLERTPGRHPLCDVSFDYHNMTRYDVAIDGIAARELEVSPAGVGMDLVITCTETPDGLTVEIDYAAGLFDRSTVSRLAEQFETVLATVCQDESVTIGQLPVAGPPTPVDVPSAPVTGPFTPVHEMIARRAADDPDAAAVIDGNGDRYTFAQLDGMANAQATRLIEAGLRPGERVALFTRRDVNLLIAQLAVLKAGGVYLPIDPQQPEARQHRIVADAAPRFAFAAPGLAAADAIPTVLDITTCTEHTGPAPAGPVVGPDDGIYAVYTSGSTGSPKGIEVRHRGVTNLWRDHDARGIFVPGDVIISLADPTFDIFTFESLLPLASGATVHMCPTSDQKDAAAIAARIAEYGVTHIQVPVSKMAALCGNRRFHAQLPALRVVVCGGEHFSENLLDLLLQDSRARIFNMYGPTETTVTATVKEFAPGDDVTIGSAVSGSAVVVVGDDGAILPDGEPGELCIMGEGLASGYINDPAKTAAVFTTLRGLPGVRVYRTGDAGHRRADGEIVLAGRLDHQVKVNGNRIELGEIEKTAMRADGVTYAVVTVSDGDLVLHYTADGADRSAQILGVIDAELPAYMRPTRLRRVTEMPKLPNKKVDRSALAVAASNSTGPAPADQSPSDSSPPTTRSDPAMTQPLPAATDVLAVTLAVWEEVLGHAVKGTDNFFAVGGNSYKLMVVNNRLGEELDLDIPLVKLFENPTPRALADALTHGPGAAEAPRGAEEPEPTGDTGTIAAVDLAAWTKQWQASPRPAAPAATAGGSDSARKIAVIGMSGVLPGAATIAEHWENRFAGVDSVSRFTRDELLASGFDEATIDDPRYVNARGHVAADTFDADFFEYSAREAETMDPQLRLLHETSWHALEDGGYVPGEYSGDIALFVGSGTNFTWMAGFLARKDDALRAFEAMTTNEKDFLATKVAYKLGLTGPAVNVQTACSTSLVAIHQAVRTLRQGEADMALAGGVALNFPRKEGYAWNEGMIFSRDGVCRPFSQDADGTVAGQGCGVVLLKPLDTALADGDHIYAVIAGSAMNNDGHAKVGYTAPSVRGQEQVIRAALADAAVDPDDVSFVETHGTGTANGDPIEYSALASVYGQGGPVALGAAKANVGHLDAAAGVAGFIGAVGVLARGQVPPMANFSALNSGIEAGDQIYVPTEATSPPGGVRLAAVSSFGIGGTNVHVVLEAAPERPQLADDGEEWILPVSARTEGSRRRMQDAVAEFLAEGHPARHVSATLAAGRAQFESRAAAIRVPGRPLEWIEPSSAPLTLDASDGVRLTLAAPSSSPSPAEAAFDRALDRMLRVFEDGLRGEVREALYRPVDDNVALDHIAQFIVRATLARFAGPETLYAAGGNDRLLRIALAVEGAQIRIGEAMRHLQAGTVPETSRPTAATGGALLDTAGPVAPHHLARLLAARWVHGADVDRARFTAPGRHVPMPGYAFEPRRFVSDIRWDQIGTAVSGTTADRTAGTPAVTPRSGAAAPEGRSAPVAAVGQDEGTPGDALRDSWVDVLGSEPTDDADFLRAGGDSLTAVRFTALIEKRMGVSITVGEMFTDASYPAIRALLDTKLPAEPATTVATDDSDGTPLPQQGDGAGRSERGSAESPASPAQRRIYAACALRDDDTAYNLGIAYKVTGPLDIPRLRQAFRQVVARHEQARTSFHLATDGSLVQRAHDDTHDVVHATTASPARVEARLAAGPRPFDLAAAPLLRVEVLSVDDEEHYLLLDMHHIVGDQASLEIIADDLARAMRGTEPRPAPLRYTDYVAALADLDETGRFDDDVEFFAGQLRDDVPRLELPADRIPPEQATFDGERHSFTCAASRQDVADLARECGVTPFMVVLAAITRVLSVHSGQREFLLGTAVSGRQVPGSEHTVGMFVNALPLRVSDLAERTVGEALASARDSVSAVLGHQNAPFEAVLSRLGIQPGGDTNALFDVMFSYVSTGTDELTLDGLEIEPLPHGHIKSRYALSFSVAERAQDFVIDLEYRTEMFDAETIARLGSQLDQYLLAMTRDAGRRVADLPLEPSAEREVRRAALTATGPAITESLLDRIRDAFSRHAELPALRWEGEEWSYGELDRLTDGLAGGLQASGVRAGDFVLCLLERGPWQVFSRIALMKCGAIEVPLDAGLPDERVAGILGDSGAAVVLATEPESRAWPAGVAAHRPEDLTGKYAPPSDITADSPLIMIYTSGTTGRPKGTLVTHGGVLSTCADNGYMDYRPGMRVLHLTGYTFDPSLLDIHSAFLAGATLVMGGREHNMDMNRLADFLREERAEAGILITAVFHLLMAERPEALAGMSALYVGGEAMQPWAAQRAFDVLGAGKLYNLYGPTEASICTTYFRVDERPDYDRMPIGVPARNRDLYIVHPDGTDVPRGVTGELCVGGPSVALGYHRRTELTAEKFVEGLAGDSGRVYRTGDRVVLDDADRIVYLDRIDRQIKHAGYRIELGEIEMATQEHAGITEAVVLHHKEGTDSRLTGFYTGQEAPSEAELRDYLLAKLPNYMVPNRLVLLPELPLTTHGKIDRHRLADRLSESATLPPAETSAAPAPGEGTSGTTGEQPRSAEASSQEDEPRTGIGAADVLAAFREVLGVPGLAGDDDFFASGGQSLQAITLVRRLREDGVEVAVTDLYRHPTADGLVAAVLPDAAPVEPVPADEVPVAAPTRDTSRRTLSAAQLRRTVAWAVNDSVRLTGSFADEDATDAYTIGALGRLHQDSEVEAGGFLQVVPGASVEELADAIARATTRHESLRARLVGDRFQLMERELFDQLPDLLPVLDARRIDQEQLGDIIEDLAYGLQKEAFAEGLLWRCVIIRVSDDELQVVWALHHAVFDGFSAGILKDEISRVLRGEELPEPQQFGAFLGTLADPARIGGADDAKNSAESDGFDYLAWAAANRAQAGPTATGSPRGRIMVESYPLGDDHPLDLGLRKVHERLSELSGEQQVAIGWVHSVRRFVGHDWSDCFGEFLDLVPVMLTGESDQSELADRLARVGDVGLHFVHALADQGDLGTLTDVRTAYWNDERKLDFVLVNFQGHIAPHEVLEAATDAPTVARTHVSVWYDDEKLHIEWIDDPELHTSQDAEELATRELAHEVGAMA